MKVSTVRFPRSGRAASAFVVSLGMLLGVPVLDGCSGDGRSLSEEGPDGAAAAPSESGGAGSGGRGSQTPTDGGLADGAAGEVVDASQGGEGGGTPATSTGGAAGSSSMSGGAAGVGGAAGAGGTAGAAGGSAGGGGNGGGGNGGGGAASKCGNGMLDPGEECDDGNQLEDDNCALCSDRHDCLACQLDGCDPPVTPGCSRFTNADEKAACESVYSCMARTECAFEKDSPTHSGGVTFCYCGDTAIADCRGGNPKGPCRAEMDASFKKYHGDLETTDPATLHTNIGVVTYPHGAAGALWQCAQRYCYDEPSNPDFPQFVCSPTKHPKPSGAGGASSGGTNSGGTNSGGTSSGGTSSGGTSSGGTSSGGTNSGGTSSGGTSSGGTSSGGASGSGGVGGSGGAVSYCDGPRPTPVADPDVCDQCEQIFCDVPVAPGCSRYAPGSTERTQCTEVLACIRSTNCINQGNVNCYCGSAGITACKGSADAATGACKAKITAGFPPGSDAATIVNNIAQLTSPAGAALALGQCDYSQCGEATGLECIPYCQ